MHEQHLTSLMQSSQKESSILDPLEDTISAIELIRVSGSDIDIVNAARVSYGKRVTELNNHDHKLISYLAKHNHTSPFEHNQLSYRIKSPIFVSRQWMRHRMNSYNEISYRYVKAPLQFYIPDKWRSQDLVNRQGSVGSFENKEFTKKYSEALEKSALVYTELLNQGVCRELARGLLPLCTYTEFIFTCNLHSLVHFLTLRLHEGSQYEIRQFARGLFLLAQPYFPVSLDAWQKAKNFNI